MAAVKNVLFIMTDQQRWDYLGCMGHPTLETPNLDALAAKGVAFKRSYCQAPMCGSSRMSTYTGRHMTTHGAIYNNIPFSVDEHTFGDYLNPLGVRTVLVGKTHMAVDAEGLARLGIDRFSELGVFLAECGFEPFERDDGLHPHEIADPNLAYNVWLREKGYDGDNPWHDWANSAAGPNGEILSGWQMRHAPLPARVAAEHSETAYMTGRAMEFMDEAGDGPWCLHLSYIKPHWPYIAPAPYHDMYSANQVPAANRTAAERDNPHPVHRAFMDHADSITFAEDETRRAVIPAYMGLIREIDDQLGRLFAFMETRGRMDDTMIVFTSDHGDYLGDHWLGEKEYLHDESVRVPLILYDPDPRADATRGRIDERLTQSIDLLPTFLEALGGVDDGQRLEGQSLLPLVRDGGSAPDWRQYAVSETDYAMRDAAKRLGVPPAEARGYMITDGAWKYMLWEHFPAQLFHLEADPGEQIDLGGKGLAAERDLHEQLFIHFRRRRTRTVMSDKDITRKAGKANQLKRGYRIGEW